MNEYLFVLGKNPDLSLAELKSYFEANNFDYELIEKTDNFAVFKFKNPLVNIIDHLGGTIKLVEVEKTIQLNDRIEDEIEALIPEKIKSRYFGVSVYTKGKAHNSDFKLAKKLSLKIKKSTGLKFLPYPKDRGMPELIHVEVIKKNLIEDSFELVIGLGERKYLGKTIQIHNPFEFKKRDVARPKQRPIFSIPPRLAKIMINLSKCKPNQKLLDPFCGIGTIIQEALMEGINAVGMDIDQETVNSARANLKWLGERYSLKLKRLDDVVLQGDVKKLTETFKKGSFDAIVTEPYLGPPLPRHVDEKEGREIIKDIEPLFRGAFHEFSAIIKPEGTIVIVIPLIRTAMRNIGMNTEFIQNCGFSVENKFMDYEERHRTLREIYVIKKKKKI